MNAARRSCVIAVDGLDGSGKSRLAAVLAEVLTAGGRPATILHVDDHRRPLDFAGLDAAAEAALYYDDYFDFAAMAASVRERVASGTAGQVTIVEGVMLRRAELPPATWHVVLEVSPAEARRRIRARDQARGRSAEEVTRRIDRRYFPAQARYRAQHDPVGRAHAVIDNEDWRRPRLVRRAAAWPADLIGALTQALDVGPGAPA